MLKLLMHILFKYNTNTIQSIYTCLFFLFFFVYTSKRLNQSGPEKVYGISKLEEKKSGKIVGMFFWKCANLNYLKPSSINIYIDTNTYRSIWCLVEVLPPVGTPTSCVLGKWAWRRTSRWNMFSCIRCFLFYSENLKIFSTVRTWKLWKRKS